MTSPVSDCDTKNTDLSKLGSYRISDTAQCIKRPVYKYLEYMNPGRFASGRFALIY